MVAKRKADWVPARQEVIWIDCNPQAGREMRDRQPFLVLSPRTFNERTLVLSPRTFNERTSLVIGLPMTTASYNANNPFAVVAGIAGGAKSGKTSYVLCHQPKSFDWRIREAAPHPMGNLTDARFAEVCGVLNQIVQLG